jgi:hypothetical protein
MSAFATKSASIAAARAKGAPVSYELVINEEQRQALLFVIQTHGLDMPDTPLEYWDAMLTELPQVEVANPGVLHGFCL